MYADDHQIYEAGKDLANVRSSLNRNTAKASKWYDDNMFKGNHSKYKTMVMQSKRENKSDHEYSGQRNGVDKEAKPFRSDNR